jgi:hypothetical protein
MAVFFLQIIDGAIDETLVLSKSNLQIDLKQPKTWLFSYFRSHITL